MPQTRAQSLSIAAIILLSGCATQLQDASVAQGETLTDFHYRMVLDNIAMFRVRPESLPWHINITGGGAQVASTVTPTLSLTWPPVSRMLELSGSQGLTINWNLQTVDAAQLKTLRDLYRTETMEENFANYYAAGYAAPAEVYGKYRELYVWPKDWEHFVRTVLCVLEKAPASKTSGSGPAPMLLTPLR